MPDWWGSRTDVSKRLRVEVEAMRSTFGDSFRLIVPRKGALHWVGEVDINMTGVPKRTHLVKIIYPPDYPARPPEAYVLKPYIYSQKHQFEDGQLCLFNPKDGTTYGWNPSRSTVVTVAGWAIQWLYAYYTWKQIGVWPGEEEHIKNKKRSLFGRG
ncbi:hypothetical protein ACFLYO_08620 [Chloroflexota bacterium]